uniref:Major facilitator superfamily (MFS) profile domain-containing protein n=1 Tax=Tetraselmis chuii TaxID=63592 RepID=A0A7S1SG99_9CHLO|mmetsp:Transcript_10042/g.18097  ORF Transcript_10042/g.18097 Transcript_10042/m.18097 type:complete len:665 (+) Transcript_10042:350-2344(+)
MATVVLPWLRQPSKGTQYGLRANAFQALVVCVLTVLVGGVLQVVKLMAVDSAGREFGLGTYSSKLAYLLPFGLSKALANLVVGYASDKVGRKTMECVGWMIGLFVPICLAAAAKGGVWVWVVIATVFLGGHQGFAWSCMIFISVDLLGPASKGLAVGLNETVGYTSVAVFATVYKWLENSVTCSWSASALEHGVENSVSSECISVSNGECASPDSWTMQCIGWCSCHGYTRTVAYATAALMGAGLLLSLFFLRETKDSHLKHETQQENEPAISLEEDELPQLSEAYLSGLRLMMHQSKQREQHGAARGRRISRSNSAPLAKDGDADTLTLLQHQGMEKEVQMSPVHSDTAPQPDTDLAQGNVACIKEEAGEGRSPEDRAGPSVDLAPLTKESSLELRGVPLDEVPDLPRYRRTDDTVIAYSAAGGRSSKFSVSEFPLYQAARPSSMRTRSMLVICFAGFVVNMTSGLAWGLLLAWARDGLGMDGAQRNLASACYESLKGMSQFLAGLLSDRVGRKWPMAVGLFVTASGLLVVVFGMGFDGAFLATGSSDGQVAELQFGHLILAACLMGIGSGIAYPVMIAAVADHSCAAKRARNIGIFRFWRDLGYAGGAVSGLLSDASSPEAAISINAVLVALTGFAVSTSYAEQLSQAFTGERQRVASAHGA